MNFNPLRTGCDWSSPVVRGRSHTTERKIMDGTTWIDATSLPYILTKREAAVLARLSERTLDRLAEDGRGPRRVSLSTRRVGYHRAELLAWLRSRTERSGIGDGHKPDPTQSTTS